MKVLLDHLDDVISSCGRLFWSHLKLQIGPVKAGCKPKTKGGELLIKTVCLIIGDHNSLLSELSIIIVTGCTYSKSGPVARSGQHSPCTQRVLGLSLGLVEHFS